MPPAATLATTRWGSGLWITSLLAGVAAVLMVVASQLPSSLGVPLIGGKGNFPLDGAGDEVTYCYQGVKTEASPAGHGDVKKKVNCFRVSPSTGLFTRVFDSSAVSTTKDKEERIRKGYVLPGLWDGHGHLVQYGEFLHSANLFGSTSFDEIRERLREYLDKNPGGVGGRENWYVSLCGFLSFPFAYSRF